MQRAANSKGPGLPSEPFEASTTNSDGKCTAQVAPAPLHPVVGLFVVVHRIKRAGRDAEDLGRSLGESDSPLTDERASATLIGRAVTERVAKALLHRALDLLPKAVRDHGDGDTWTIPTAMALYAPPTLCPLASASYFGRCATSPCSHWRELQPGSGTCACLPIEDAP